MRVTPEERAVIVAWELCAHSASIEWFKDQLEQQARPEWNRAVARIADAIREGENEARDLAREAVTVRTQGDEATFLAGWAESAESLGHFPCYCDECGAPALASMGGVKCLGHNFGEYCDYPRSEPALTPELVEDFVGQLVLRRRVSRVLRT